MGAVRRLEVVREVAAAKQPKPKGRRNVNGQGSIPPAS